MFLDYIRCKLKLGFHTPRYMVTRETGLEHLKINWGTESMNSERKIREMKNDSLVKQC